MIRNRWIHFGAAIAVGCLPVLLWAYAIGPDAGKTGAPGEDPASCTSSSCHNGPITKDASGIEILWEGGSSYQPGFKQRFTIKVKDGAAVRYGIQVSARADSGPLQTNQAGSFTPLSPDMFVLCSNNRERSLSPGGVCPATAPVEYIEHSTPSATGEFAFDWTPPANTSAGSVTIYVAANASTGRNAPQGAKILQKTLKLQPSAAPGGIQPNISAGGAVSASAFGGGTKVAAGSYLEIFGKDLALATRSWRGDEFVNGKAPTNLENTQVSIDGKPAFVYFISPGQLNVVVPDGIAEAPIQVVVKTPGGSSDPVLVTGAKRAPGILAPSSFIVGGKQYVVAQFADGAYAGKESLIAGLSFRTPKPGDRIIIYGLGFGATSPAIPAGTITSIASDLGSTFRVSIGGVTAATEYKGLAPNFVGLYQFNVVVPNLQAGDQEVLMEIDGVKTQSGVYLTTAN
ncbi:choice-of-anchor V domain-containing protein [Bryobacter aggregatus]|uniref:choice-of-anchor V domain-containing protein n=1 Tax=Bryobacter aggregatus TaxID=360054 RepID=UPI0004E28CC3|nr:choice-of-anchor V domain-containing protein [Bryobacter aggregatus]